MNSIHESLNAIECQSLDDVNVVKAIAVLASKLDEHPDVDTKEAEKIVAKVVKLFNKANDDDDCTPEAETAKAEKKADKIIEKKAPKPPAPRQFSLSKKK